MMNLLAHLGFLTLMGVMGFAAGYVDVAGSRIVYLFATLMFLALWRDLTSDEDDRKAGA